MTVGGGRRKCGAGEQQQADSGGDGDAVEVSVQGGPECSDGPVGRPLGGTTGTARATIPLSLSTGHPGSAATLWFRRSGEVRGRAASRPPTSAAPRERGFGRYQWLEGEGWTVGSCDATPAVGTPHRPRKSSLIYKAVALYNPRRHFLLRYPYERRNPAADAYNGQQARDCDLRSPPPSRPTPWKEVNARPSR